MNNNVCVVTALDREGDGYSGMCYLLLVYLVCLVLITYMQYRD